MASGSWSSPERYERTPPYISEIDLWIKKPWATLFGSPDGAQERVNSGWIGKVAFADITLFIAIFLLNQTFCSWEKTVFVPNHTWEQHLKNTDFLWLFMSPPL